MGRLGLVVAAIAVLSLGIGFVWKGECTYTAWEDDWQYHHYCYSDILPLWFGHHLDQRVVADGEPPSHHPAIPYLEEPNEYPVLTAGFMWSVAAVTHGLVAYMNVTFVLLSLAGALATYALWRLKMPPARILFWVAGPTLIIHGLTNWDLLAVALAAGGWLAWRSKNPFLSALLLGLGGAAKLYPAFFLPFIFLAAWRAKDRPAAQRVALGGALGLLLPNYLVAIAAPKEWLGMWLFQAHRPPDFETIWASIIQPFVHWLSPAYDSPELWTSIAGWVGAATMALALALLARRVWAKGLDPLAAGGLLTLVFLLVNKVYSPQYTLWALPILLILEADWVPLVLFTVADTANFFIRYNVLTTLENQPESPLAVWGHLAVDLRWLFLLWATWSILVRYRCIVAPWAQRVRAPWRRLAAPNSPALD